MSNDVQWKNICPDSGSVRFHLGTLEQYLFILPVHEETKLNTQKCHMYSHFEIHNQSQYP